MPSFEYRGRDNGGILVTGTIQAVNLDAAAADLSSDQITPIDIHEIKDGQERDHKESRQKHGEGKSIKDVIIGSGVNINDLIIFARQMHSLTRSGLPLDRALKGLEASMANAAMKKVLQDLMLQLEKGVNLSGAMNRHPKVFSPLFLSLVHVGENTGRLDLAFEQVGRYLILERDTAKQIKSATRYPLFVISVIVVALAVITVFVIPVFAETFEKMNAPLPWQTVLLIDISDFVVAYWALILAACLGSVVGFMAYIRTERGNTKWDKAKLRFPLVGRIFEQVALSRFARTFSSLMKTGVPVVQALGVIAGAVGNLHIGGHVVKMRDGISHGESLYQTAVRSGMFTPLVLQMIAVGEQSGNIDELLEEVADFYDAEVEYDLKRLSSAIEPILIIFIAGMVLVLALGVFLPIWDLASAAR